MTSREASYELQTRSDSATEEEPIRRSLSHQFTPRRISNMSEEGVLNASVQNRLARRTLRKLDFILLPFLSTLFLLNSLDKSNIGNAETAGFTRDAGLSPKDLNTSMAYFFAFFVALQPLGAALGRKYGMKRWVPACMSLWGLCTLLHIWVHKRWQLIILRITIATLESGFYPTTVSYLSLFYTRYEFAVRLGFFYGQSAVAGAVGGVLSWAVFERFHGSHGDDDGLPSDTRPAGRGDWRSWEVLFLIEGCLTMIIALVGFFWLPHSADTAWFFTEREKVWAEQRIRLDHVESSSVGPNNEDNTDIDGQAANGAGYHSTENDEDAVDDHAGLLQPKRRASPRNRKMSTVSTLSLTADSGLDKHDIISALAQYKIWHLLICNILSAIPATAFGVFLPLVMKRLSPRLNLSPAASNLLSAPPFVFGAVALFFFARWSDRSHQRLNPVLWGLALLLVGLTLTVMTPIDSYVLRYMSLCTLLSGSFIASPLTVAWLANNTPEPGKRAILLGINGWGNLAGVFSALLFTPEDEKEGYMRPFFITLVCVGLAFAGFAAFRMMLVRENKKRDEVLTDWSEEEYRREDMAGDVHILADGRPSRLAWLMGSLPMFAQSGAGRTRRGDEKLTYRYSL